ncbi:hypothetical protein [Sediminibacterium soli]|uniref:hypothetical protein n=1 Tax=Sediminibacterium soli TaxID=2698829 RepID=UPI00137AE06A|nr:hypothetical protein [Sediminibacterium soli]NCI45974.1 hypothetical protein [Sediminibacterium soli]
MFWLFDASKYEHRYQPLASKKVFLKRLKRNVLLASCILSVCLLIGVVGYRFGGPMSWIDALHNASMILSGMGPVAEVKTTGGKLFSSVYALFSGVAFITNIGILLTPIAHRFFHKLHAEEK